MTVTDLPLGACRRRSFNRRGAGGTGGGGVAAARADGGRRRTDLLHGTTRLHHRVEVGLARPAGPGDLLDALRVSKRPAEQPPAYIRQRYADGDDGVSAVGRVSDGAEGGRQSPDLVVPAAVLDPGGVAHDDYEPQRLFSEQGSNLG